MFIASRGSRHQWDSVKCSCGGEWHRGKVEQPWVDLDMWLLKHFHPETYRTDTWAAQRDGATHKTYYPRRVMDEILSMLKQIAKGVDDLKASFAKAERKRGEEDEEPSEMDGLLKGVLGSLMGGGGNPIASILAQFTGAGASAAAPPPPHGYYPPPPHGYYPPPPHGYYPPPPPPPAPHPAHSAQQANDGGAPPR